MNMLGVRPLMQAPPLPRITSQDPPADHDGGETPRSMQRKPVEQTDRRLPTWKAEPPAPSRPSMPTRDVRSTGARPAVPVVSEKSALPPSRAAAPAAAVARMVDAATAARLRPGTVVRLAVGDFEIALVVKDSRLYGKVLAKSGSAKDLIEGHLDDLRRGLERRGIEIAAFEVIVAEPSPEAGVRSVRRHRVDVLA